MANSADEAASPQYYLEDLKVGQRFTSASCRIEKEQIVNFASEFDPQRFHLDEDLAKRTLFRGLAASGWHTATSFTLKVRLQTSDRYTPIRTVAL
jgi:acyl dehydratase